jgi:hypothetical protein
MTATSLGKNCKALPISEPKQHSAHSRKAGFEGEGEVRLRSPGQIRDEHVGAFREPNAGVKIPKQASPAR